ncbi:MAG: class I SAM-dependent methyltransferase [Xanthomonadales bacterium]
MYDLLHALGSRPEPFAENTIRDLWTRPHLARKMLEYHLSQDTDHASRRVEEIDRIVAWLDDQLTLAGKRVVDLGCGPGLYARRMARAGAEVSGVDFSRVALDYARTRCMDHVRYLEADYLVDELPGGFDVATLVYYDFCALGPDDRARLLGRIRDLLAPGGLLALDLAGPGAFAEVEDGVVIEPRLMAGFFAPGDYVGIHRTDVYEEAEISLDRFAVFEPGEAWQIWNWVQYYTPERAAAEFAEAGFMIRALTGGLDGTPLAPHSRTLGVIAEPA